MIWNSNLQTVALCCCSAGGPAKAPDPGPPRSRAFAGPPVVEVACLPLVVFDMFMTDSCDVCHACHVFSMFNVMFVMSHGRSFGS